MNSLDFCYWLQGFFELSKKSQLKELDENQVQTIKYHLKLVFVKETPDNWNEQEKGNFGTCGFSKPISEPKELNY